MVTGQGKAMTQKRGILGRLERLRRDRRGVVVAMFAVMFPVVLAIVALGVETGLWFSVKRHDQAVADVAAISGATELMNFQTGYGTCGSGSGAAVAIACPAAASIAKSNGFDFGDSTNSGSSLTYPYTGSPCPSGAECVQVILEHQQGLLTAGYFLSSLTIGNEAIAAIEDSPKQPCATAFGGNSKNTGLILTGTSSISMKDCLLATNSTSVDSVQVNGNAGLDLYSIYSAGGISFGNNCANNNCTLTYPPSVYQPKIKDPYARVTVQQSPADLSSFPTSLVTTWPTPPTAPLVTPQKNCPSSTINLTGDLSPANAIANTCYSENGGTVTLIGGTFAPGQYYFGASVIVAGAVTIDPGVTIYVTNGGFTVAATGSLTFAANTGGSAQTESIAVYPGSFDASLGTVTFSGASSKAASYAISASNGSTFGNASCGTTAICFGAATFGGGSYGFDGGSLTIAPPSGGTATFANGNYYVDAGDFTIDGSATFAASSSAAPTWIQVKSGSFTTAAGGILSFTGGGGSQYNICLGKCATGGTNSYGVSLAGAATFGSATYYIVDASSAAGGIAVASGGSATFASGLYAIQHGNFRVNSGGSAVFDAGSFCQPSGSTAASCIDIANGGFINAGTTTFAIGDFYIIDGPIGGSGGFENIGTLKIGGTPSGGGYSNYYFFNGASYGTSGTSSGKCAGSNAGSGVYGALSVMGGSTADFGPGNYYLVNGDLCLHQDTSNATDPTVNCVGCTLDGTGITFILTGSGSTPSSEIGTLQIPAPINTSSDPLYPNVAPSPYAGLLVYQDRNAPLDTWTGAIGSVGSCQSNCSQLQGGSDTNMTGAIYMPQAALTYGAQSGSATSAGKCLVLLVDSLVLEGGATLSTSGCQSAGVANSTIKYVALVQ
jgi:Putative Flp pilus-assembly TadE/G-like